MDEMIYLKRKIYNKLVDWKNNDNGQTALLIEGARRIGKSTIAEEFANDYSEYIKVINKLNGGVSSARNKGLELAKGEYILFADPDDFLTGDYFGTIIKAVDDYGHRDRPRYRP